MYDVRKSFRLKLITLRPDKRHLLRKPHNIHGILNESKSLEHQLNHGNLVDNVHNLSISFLDKSLQFQLFLMFHTENERTSINFLKSRYNGSVSVRADASTTFSENAVLHKAIYIRLADVMCLLLVICIALHSPDGGLVQ